MGRLQKLDSNALSSDLSVGGFMPASACVDLADRDDTSAPPASSAPTKGNRATRKRSTAPATKPAAAQSSKRRKGVTRGQQSFMANWMVKPQSEPAGAKDEAAACPPERRGLAAGDALDLTGEDKSDDARAAPRPTRAPRSLEDELQSHFGHKSFRCQEQHSAVDAVLKGRDVFVMMPTGTGKSVCFQLPAMITNVTRGALTVVVSPLLALMKEQVQTLQSQGKRVRMLCSDISAKQRASTWAELNAMAKPFTLSSGGGGGAATRGLALLYVTPEALRSGTLLPMLEKLHAVGRLGLLAVDEAHCISSWGHDFRPAYRQLNCLKATFGAAVPLIALTATATRSMQQDILSSLRVTNAAVFYMGFDRPNIYYTVVHKSALLTAVRCSLPLLFWVEVKEDC